jgi:hypothetical protein
MFVGLDSPREYWHKSIIYEYHSEIGVLLTNFAISSTWAPEMYLVDSAIFPQKWDDPGLKPPAVSLS